MNHTQIRAFHAVAMLGSFSKAAEKLLLTQPAISEQVRRLEQENDMLLFQRSRKGAQLTPDGASLFHLTKRYFAIEDEIDDCLKEWNARLAGHLRLVADSAQHVTDLVCRFRARYPSVRITIRSGNTQTVFNELRAYNAEIGVVGSPPQAREMVALNIGASPIIAFAHRDFLSEARSGMTLAELAQYPLVLREDGSKTRQHILDGARQSGVRIAPAFEVEGREAVRSIVLSGGGIGFVSEAEFGPDDRLAPIQILDLKARMPESIVHLSQRGDVRLIRTFMDFAVASTRQEGTG